MTRRTVLVIDDEADLREMLVLDINSWGYETLEAESVPAALELLRSNTVDAILTDYLMPQATGVDLLNALKQMGRWPLPLFLMTGFSDLTEEQVKELGAAGLFSKPFDRKSLRQALDAALKGPRVP